MTASQPAAAGVRWPVLPAEAVLASAGAGLVAMSAANRPADMALVVIATVPLVYLAVLYPPLALVSLLVVHVSGIDSVVGSHAGLNPSALALAVAVSSLLLAARRGEFRLGPSPMYVLIAGVVFAEALSLLNRQAGIFAMAGLVETLKDVAIFIALVGLLRTTGRYRSAARLLVVTVGFLFGLSLMQRYWLHDGTTFGGFRHVPPSASALLFGGALLVSLRALMTTGDTAVGQRRLAAAIVVGLVAWAAAGMLRPTADPRYLLVLAALATALDIEARLPGVPVPSPWLSGTAVSDQQAGRRRRKATAVGLLAAGIVGGVELWALNVAVPRLDPQPAAYTADASAQVRHPGDTTSRRTLLPTYVAIAANPRFQHEASQQIGLPANLARDIRVRVVGDRSSASMTVSVRAPNASIATVEADSLMQQLYRYFVSLPSLYRLTPLGGHAVGKVRVYRERSSVAAAALAMLASGAAAGAGLGGRRAWLRRSRPRRLEAFGAKRRPPGH